MYSAAWRVADECLAVLASTHSMAKPSLSGYRYELVLAANQFVTSRQSKRTCFVCETGVSEKIASFPRTDSPRVQQTTSQTTKPIRDNASSQQTTNTYSRRHHLCAYTAQSGLLSGLLSAGWQRFLSLSLCCQLVSLLRQTDVAHGRSVYLDAVWNARRSVTIAVVPSKNNIYNIETDTRAYSTHDSQANY